MRKRTAGIEHRCHQLRLCANRFTNLPVCETQYWTDYMVIYFVYSSEYFPSVKLQIHYKCVVLTVDYEEPGEMPRLSGCVGHLPLCRRGPCSLPSEKTRADNPVALRVSGTWHLLKSRCSRTLRWAISYMCIHCHRVSVPGHHVIWLFQEATRFTTQVGKILKSSSSLLSFPKPTVSTPKNRNI